jgi:hypothetical protein
VALYQVDNGRAVGADQGGVRWESGLFIVGGTDHLNASGPLMDFVKAKSLQAGDQLSGADILKAEQMLKLMEKLEDNDDVQNVYTNADISDEIIAEIFG